MQAPERTRHRVVKIPPDQSLRDPISWWNTDQSRRLADAKTTFKKRWFHAQARPYSSSAPTLASTMIQPKSDPSSPFPSDGGDRSQANRKGPQLQAAPSPLDDATRSLPFSNDAERGVLSCMLQLPEELVGRAIEVLRPEAFYSAAHRLLFETLIDLNRKAQPIDPVTLNQVLTDRKQIDQVGGQAALLEILDFVPTPAHFEFYVDIVNDKYTVRRVIQTCSESITRAYEDEEDVDGLLDEAEKSVLAIREEMDRGAAVRPLREHVLTALDDFETMARNPDAMRGVPTGFSRLDRMTFGLHGGDMFIIAARPSMGKTSLLMNMVEHIAVDQKTPVAVFSLEMSAKMLVRRLIVSRANINMSKLLGGLLTDAESTHLVRAVGELEKAEIIIDDTPGIAIDEFRAKARRYKKQHGIGLIAVDYLQLLTSRSRRAKDNRQIEIAEISAGLKNTAKELDLPIIVLAQLNRQVEQRKSARPMLSDLRESGSIEQDADLVGLLTRNNYAGSKTDEKDKDDNPFGDDDDEEKGNDGDSLLVIAKHRNGPTGDVHLRFIDQSMRFVDREPRKHEEGD